MKDDFIGFMKNALEKIEYKVEVNPQIPGCRGLIYASSPLITTVGPLKFRNHFIFLDWDADLFGRLENLLDAQKKFSKFVNQEYKVPNGWRIKIPNLAVMALSERGFTQEAIDCATNRYFIPWMGGEVGQIMLLDLLKYELTHHYKKTYKQTGSIPLGFAVSEISRVFADYQKTLHE